MRLDSDKLLFIHIPRTGGTSIEIALNPERKGSDHFSLDEAVKRWGSELARDYYTFSFVRDPFSRILSGYSYRINGGNKTSLDWQLASELPNNFMEFIMQIEQFEDYHFKPLTYWLDSDEAGVDFIGRFENIKEDFEKLCNILGKGKVNLPHVRKSSHLHWKKYYSDQMKNKMLEFYHDDFKRFYPEYINS